MSIHNTLRAHVQHTAQQIADVCAYGIVGCTIIDLLPPMAALLSIVWIVIQIYYKIKNERSKKEDN